MANFAQDDFSSEVSDGTALVGQTDNLGNTWALGSGSANDVVVSTSISPHALTCRGTFTAPRARNPGAPASADYTVQGDVFINNTTAASFAGVLGRMASGADTYYGVWGETDTANWTLIKQVAGVQTILGTASHTFTVGSTRTVQLIMSGSAISVTDNGATIISVTDTDIAAAGFSGVRIQSVGDANGTVLQNFSAFPNASTDVLFAQAIF